MVRESRAAPKGSTLAARHLRASTEDARQPLDAKCLSDPFRHSCPCVEKLDACLMYPKLRPQVLLVPPVLHGNRQNEWAKLSEPDELKKLGMKLIHIHFTASRAGALYDKDTH